MGSIWIKKNQGWSFVDEFHNRCVKETGIIPGHMKWTKVPNNIEGKYFYNYKLLVDLFFEYCDGRNMFFKTIIADSTYDFKSIKYNQGDYETGFYKLYYYLILNSLRTDERYHIRIANRTVSKKRTEISESERLADLMRCLNLGYSKKSKYLFRDDLVLSIEPRPARDRRLIQLADILMGAVGFHWEGLHEKVGAKESKVYLAKYIATKLGKPNLKFTTSVSNRSFNVFNILPRK